MLPLSGCCRSNMRKYNERTLRRSRRILYGSTKRALWTNDRSIPVHARLQSRVSRADLPTAPMSTRSNQTNLSGILSRNTQVLFLGVSICKITVISPFYFEHSLPESVKICSSVLQVVSAGRGCCVPPIKKRGEEARGFTTVRGAPQNGDGRFSDHAPDGSAALQNLYFFKRGAQNFRKPRKCTKKKKKKKKSDPKSPGLP